MFHCVMGLMIFYVAAKQTCFAEGANGSDEYYLWWGGGCLFVFWSVKLKVSANSNRIRPKTLGHGGIWNLELKQSRSGASL